MPLRDLCTRCEAAGFGSVTSVLATGNLVLVGAGDQCFVADVVARGVASFDLSNAVFVRPPLELSKMVSANLFPDAAEDHPHHLVLHFQQTPPHEAALATVLAHSGPERGGQLFAEACCLQLASPLKLSSLSSVTVLDPNLTSRRHGP